MHDCQIPFQCPNCRGKIAHEKPYFKCVSGHLFNANEGVIDFSSENFPLPAIYNDPEFKKWLNIAAQIRANSYKKGSLIGVIQDCGHRLLESWACKKEEGWRLDLGCGSGRHFDFVLDGRSVIGFDSNPDSLKTAFKNNPQSIFIRGNMEWLPFVDGFFEVVYAIFSLEHAYCLERCVREIKRVLNKNGVLLVALPAEGGFLFNLLRELTTIPDMRRRYGIDYRKVMRIEHCNTASKVIAALREQFRPLRSRFFPFFLPSANINLTILSSYESA